MSFSTFTLPELLVLRRCLQLNIGENGTATLLGKCQQEIINRSYGTMFKRTEGTPCT